MAHQISLPNDWEPRGYQLPLWSYLERGGTRAVAIWHRRAGKDSVCLNWAAVAAHLRTGTYWHCLPHASQARKAIWEAVNPHTGIRLIDQAFPRALRESTRENDMMIRFKNGSTWQVVGSDNYNSLVGSPPVGVVFSEWALCDPAAWDYIRPILVENGGWAFFITTPRGRNHGYSMFNLAMQSEDWFGEKLTVDQTQALDADALANEKAELISLYGEDDGLIRYEQEYECSFDAALPGAYYASQLRAARKEGRITDLPIDPNLPVYTYWDIGYRDSTAIWFVQKVGYWLHVIDYVEDNFKALPHYAKVLQDLGYIYREHWGPHDIDKHEPGSGHTYAEVASGLGINFEKCPDLGLMEGINAARAIFPRCKFDQTRCARGIEALESYHRQWDDKRRDFVDKPYHDWASHGADAFRYLASAQSYEVDTSRLSVPQISIA